MTTPSSSSGQASMPPIKADSSNFNDWMDAVPKAVAYEDALAPDVVAKIWQKMYALSGIATGNESKKRAFRFYVYIQGVLNGTSRVGDYAGKGQLADGTEVENAVIPRACGMKIRKFYRGNMDESYMALKSTNVMVQFPRFVARAASMGIGAEEAFATADWMTDCPHFTPVEMAAHNKSFAAGISRARRAREGRTLEDVEKAEFAEQIRANGPEAAASVKDNSLGEF